MSTPHSRASERFEAGRRVLELDMQRQPDDFTCGPTCLEAIYRYYDQPLPLDQLIDEVHLLQSGGTLGVMLALHALRRGYAGRIYTCNLQVFDPSWFHRDGDHPGHHVGEPALARDELVRRLRARGEALREDDNGKMRVATNAYADFLELGGEIRMVDLTPRLIASYLRKGHPILCGLSSTWLYRAMREYGPEDDDDDIRGMPNGHFVVLVGYDGDKRQVLVADPLHPNPLSDTHLYSVSVDRLVCAILLGIVTWDANLLILRPADHREGSDPHADRR